MDKPYHSIDQHKIINKYRPPVEVSQRENNYDDFHSSKYIQKVKFCILIQEFI